MDWDADRITFADQSLASADPADPGEISLAQARGLFREFLRNYHDAEDQYVYTDQLQKRWQRREPFLEVHLAHVGEFNESLMARLQSRPAEYLPMMEAAAKEALSGLLIAANVQQQELFDIQVVLRSEQRTQSLRSLTADHVNKLIKVPGIITSTSKIRSKTTLVHIRCTKCGTVKKLSSSGPLSTVTLPNKCDRDGAPADTGEDCGLNSYVVMADLCEYIDQQSLKLQESPEVVPTGEMPRNIMLSVDRTLVDRVSPGMRVSVVGISSLYNSNAKAKLSESAVRTPFLRVVGIQLDSEGSGRSASNFTAQEEEDCRELARDPEIYEKLARSIAPQISGDYTHDIKKAIACLLVGGSRKVLPDGMRLRGDINVLLLGDPSTAKSQFLKFVEKVAPVGVYTSGKGSSAAGLTASVIKDSKGEFFLEGGAMVLADGGVICIDEFDKMRESDRVAIHEAMEQQTISIAKAGITTVLNSRASVLAAANPVFGRYDDLKSVGDNIDLMTTILSRFDLIFIVRDIHDEQRDRDIARHVLSVHINSGAMDTSQEGEIDSRRLKTFISYLRQRCAPRLSEEASAMLSNQYVSIRNDVRHRQQANPGDAMTVPITVRQLEALIRISESLAKMRLSSEATIEDVEEALRLFRVSTLSAAKAQPGLLGTARSTDELRKAEEFIRRRIAVRSTANSKRIIEEALVQGHTDDTIRRAIGAMVMRSELQELNQRKLLKRIR